MDSLKIKEIQRANKTLRKSVDSDNIPLFKTELLRALSDPTRQSIIVILGKYKALCVHELSAYFNLERSTISHHLKLLKKALLIRSRKIGKEVFYYLNTSYMKRSIRNLTNIIESIDK